LNPSQVVEALQELIQTNRKGSDALYEAEVDLAECENSLDTVEAKSFISATGSVAERTAQAKLEASEARLARDLAKARVNRIRTKLKIIESEIMAHATMSKIMQAKMKL